MLGWFRYVAVYKRLFGVSVLKTLPAGGFALSHLPAGCGEFANISFFERQNGGFF